MKGKRFVKGNKTKREGGTRSGHRGAVGFTEPRAIIYSPHGMDTVDIERRYLDLMTSISDCDLFHKFCVDFFRKIFRGHCIATISFLIARLIVAVVSRP